MKRIFSILLSFIILLCLVIPVSASDNSLNLIDLLQYQSSFDIIVNDTYTYAYIDLEFPPYTLVEYIEFYYYVFGDFTNNIQLGSNILNVSTISLGNGLYKSYAYKIPSNSVLRLNFYSTSLNPIGVNLYECKYSVVDPKYDSLPYYIIGYNDGITGRFSSDVLPGSSYNLPSKEWESSADSVTGFDFTLYVTSDEWKKYDSIQLRFDLKSTSINSCIVRIGNKVLDPGISLSNTSYVIPNPSNSISGIGTFVPMSHYTLNIDLSDVTLNFNDSLAIQVTGTYPFGLHYSDPFGIIYFVNGFRANSEPNLISFWFGSLTNNLDSWFSSLFSKLDDIFTGTEHDQAEADSFNDSISDQSNELQDLTADLNSVSRPELSDVNISTDGLVDSSVVLLATNGLGSILGNDIIIRVLLLALTFALAGFILYGKR